MVHFGTWWCPRESPQSNPSQWLVLDTPKEQPPPRKLQGAFKAWSLSSRAAFQRLCLGSRCASNPVEQRATSVEF